MEKRNGASHPCRCRHAEAVFPAHRLAEVAADVTRPTRRGDAALDSEARIRLDRPRVEIATMVGYRRQETTTVMINAATGRTRRRIVAVMTRCMCASALRRPSEMAEESRMPPTIPAAHAKPAVGKMTPNTGRRRQAPRPEAPSTSRPTRRELCDGSVQHRNASAVEEKRSHLGKKADVTTVEIRGIRCWRKGGCCTRASLTADRG